MEKALPKRDQQGHFLEAPWWLRPGFRRLNEAGYGTGGTLQRRCARVSCGDIALKASDWCRHHDVNYKRKRSMELRMNSGRAPTPAEMAKLFRADIKNLWLRLPWFPAATIWFAPRIESAFVEGCRRSGMPPALVPPVCLNTLRWVWKRSRLDVDDDAGWQRALVAARKRMATIGPPPVGYVYLPPEDTQPSDIRIKVVNQRRPLSAAQVANGRMPVDRTSKAKARKAHGHRFRAPVSFDWGAFLSEHWRSTFMRVFEMNAIDFSEVDGEIGRRIAVAWRGVLDEQANGGGSGDARAKWSELLRDIKQEQEQSASRYRR